MAYSSSLQRSVLLAGWLWLGLLTNSCEKQADPLPGPTQTGQNTFGCLLNGKTWIPNGGGGWSGLKPLTGGFYKDYTNKRHIWIQTLNSNQESIHLYLENPILGEHLLNQNTGFIPLYTPTASYGYYQANNAQVYTTSSTSTGKVTITQADTLTGLLSGTFAFTATAKSGANVPITAGRFDLISPQ